MLNVDLTKLESELVVAALAKLGNAQGVSKADKDVAKALAERIEGEAAVAYRPRAPRVPAGELEAVEEEPVEEALEDE